MSTGMHFSESSRGESIPCLSQLLVAASILSLQLHHSHFWMVVRCACMYVSMCGLPVLLFYKNLCDGISDPLDNPE